MSPTLSVVMAVKDGMPYLPEAVESILRQSFREFEFIVIDDGSQDGSFEYLTSLQDPRVQCLRHTGRGQTAALNRGLRQAKGDWIARMDGDDWSFPERLEKQLSQARDIPGATLISCDYLICDSALNPVAPIRLASPGERFYRYLHQKNNPLCHPTIFFKRVEALAVGGYDERIQNAQDYDLWIKLLKKGQFANVPEVLLKYRVVPSSLSILRQPEQTREREAILKSHASSPAVTGGGPILGSPTESFGDDVRRYATSRQRDGMYAYRLGFGAWLAGKRSACLRYIGQALLAGIRPLRCLAALFTLMMPRPLYLRLCGYNGVYR